MVRNLEKVVGVIRSFGLPQKGIPSMLGAKSPYGMEEKRIHGDS